MPIGVARLKRVEKLFHRSQCTQTLAKYVHAILCIEQQNLSIFYTLVDYFSSAFSFIRCYIVVSLVSSAFLVECASLVERT